MRAKPRWFEPGTGYYGSFAGFSMTCGFCSERSNVLLILLLSCFLFVSTAASQTTPTEEPGFSGGVVNITKVTRNSDGEDASIELTVNQLYATDETYIKRTGGTGGAGSIVADSTEKVQEIFSLRSDLISEVTHRETAKIGKGTLTCSNAQDRCYGCVSRNFSGQRRLIADGIQNVNPENRLYTVSTTYSVYRGSSSPAPNYVGSHFIRARVGQQEEIDLKPFIEYGGKAVSCEIVKANFRIGLLENPRIGDNELEITDDCVLRWNTEGGVVGSKYAFQFRIKSKSQARRPSFASSGWKGCFPTTTVDVTVEIGCSDSEQGLGNKSCFLCTDTDLVPAYSDIIAQSGALPKIVKRMNKLATREAKRCGAAEDIKAALKRTKRRVRKGSKSSAEKLGANVNAAETVAGQCLAPSDFFCSESSLVPIKDALNAEVRAMKPFLRKGRRNARSLVKRRELQGCVSKKAKRKIAKMNRQLRVAESKVLDTISGSIPDSTTRCGN